MDLEDGDDELWDRKSAKRRHSSTNSQETSRKNTKGNGPERATTSMKIDSKSNASRLRLSRKKNPTEKNTTPKKTEGKKSIQDFLGSGCDLKDNEKVVCSGDTMQYCPKCQVPKSSLVTQSLVSHVRECLEVAEDPSDTCPEGLNCRAVSPSHFKQYSHHILAVSRSSSPKRQQPCITTDNDIQKSGDRVSSNKSNKAKDGNHIATQDTLLTSFNKNVTSNDKCVNAGGYERAERTQCINESTAATIECMNTNLGKELQSSSTSIHHTNPVQHEHSSWSSSSTVHEQQINCSKYNGAASHNTDISQEKEEAELGQDWFDDTDDNEFEELLLKADSVTESESQSSEGDIFPPHNTELSSESASLKQASLKSGRELNSPIKTEASPVKSSVTCKTAAYPKKDSFTKQKSIGAYFGLKQQPPSQCNEHKTLKQQDIGVFFGLKPKASGTDAKSSSLSQNTLEPKAGRGAKGAFKLRTQSKKVNYSDGADSSVDEKPRRGAGSRCPFYKKIPDTPFTVDAFRYGSIPGIKVYFLTHFHYDHYGGLSKKFSHPLYCSKITANLVQSKIKVDKRYITSLPMNTPVVVDKVQVTLLDANHCPGAVLFLFELPSGQSILHTGDFRACPQMEKYPSLINKRVDTLYLDTTYCDPQYTFPPQEETIRFAVSKAVQAVRTNPKTLIVCGTYTIGKEKVFLAIAEELHCKVMVQSDKKRVMDCLESDAIKSMITTDKSLGRVHVIPMGKLNHQHLTSYLEQFKGRYTEVLAFKPTGWEHKSSAPLSATKPSKRGVVSIYGVPYSEHSSYEEMKRFVQFVRPDKIIPTVNVHSAARRDEMAAIFNAWLGRK